MSTDRSIVVNSDRLEDSITKFNDKIIKIDETLEKIEKLITKVNNDDLWKSSTSEEVYDSFLELKKTFPKINAELNVYSEFLKEILKDYKEEEEKQEKVIEENTTNLDINMN